MGPESDTITLKNFNKLIENKDKSVLVYISADWCMVCLKMKPVIEQTEKSFADKLNILRVDSDRDKEINDEFEVDALPVLMLYRNGEREWVHIGKFGTSNFSSVSEP